ncbi:TPA: hypothetical protein I7117_15310 [Vibrio vulnificus]|nr:hypothetical protein [Vibrio vulnificus]
MSNIQPLDLKGELTDESISSMLWMGIKSECSDFHAQTNFPFTAEINGVMTPLMTEPLTKEGARKIAFYLLDQKEGILSSIGNGHGIQYGCQVVDPQDKTNIRRLRYSGLLSRTLKFGQTITSTARLLPKKPKTGEELGLPEELIELVKSTKRGIILIVGATGSGKSTTMGGLICELLNQKGPGKKIMCFEDPIEAMYDEVERHPTNIISQHEVGDLRHGAEMVSYEEALKTCLRSAPDVLTIGELRNYETLIPAIAFSNTGHLLISTLHANCAASAYARLYNMLPTAKSDNAYYDLLSEVVCVIAQTLVHTADGRRLPLLEISYNTEEIRSQLATCTTTNEIRKVIDADLERRESTFYHLANKAYEAGLISPDELSSQRRL